MKHGWIRLHRSIIDWEWYSDPNTSRLFIHCLLRANHEDVKWRGHEIKRGQFLTSLETLSNETSLSVSQIRTAIKKLEVTSELASKSQARCRMITVLKYNLYQSDDKQVSSEIAGSSQADRKLVATDKNEKNEKNEKEVNKEPMSPKGDDLAQQVFDYWCSIFNKTTSTQFTPKRRSSVIKRLIDYSLEDIKSAIDGCSRSTYHMGKNDTGAIYNDLELICRNGEKLEQFMTNYNNLPILVETKREQNSNNLNGWATDESTRQERICSGDDIGGRYLQQNPDT
jgi:hypothetical protein